MSDTEKIKEAIEKAEFKLTPSEAAEFDRMAAQEQANKKAYFELPGKVVQCQGCNHLAQAQAELKEVRAGVEMIAERLDFYGLEERDIAIREFADRLRALVAGKEGEQAMRKATFKKELEELLNKHSRENGSDTPDFILAQFITSCLSAYEVAVQQRETWHGRDARPSEPLVAGKEGKDGCRVDEAKR